MNQLEAEILIAGLKSCDNKKDLEQWVKNELCHTSNEYPIYAFRKIKNRVLTTFNLGDLLSIKKTAIECSIEQGVGLIEQIKQYYGI